MNKMFPTDRRLHKGDTSTDRKTVEQTGRQTDKHPDRQINGHTDICNFTVAWLLKGCLYFWSIIKLVHTQEKNL